MVTTMRPIGTTGPGDAPADRPGSSADKLPVEVDLSVVIPVYNEAENLPPLHASLSRVLSALPCASEVLYVDDGSTDASFERLEAIAVGDPRVTLIQFRRNFGQTAAMSAGIDYARGRVIVFMDADLQLDPADIPVLLAKLDEGFDLVSGWRKDRQDPWLRRKLPSRFANRIISWITGQKLRDYGCTLKAYRREVLEHIHLYGEMHRFIPAFARSVGVTVAEVPVRHHPRVHGRSKYGLDRTFRVILDLLTVKFLNSFAGNPIYLFGGAGLVLIALSLFNGLAMLAQKLLYGVSFIQTPLLLLAALFFILGVQSILLGLTAELVIRTYHESQGKPIYVIRRIHRAAP
jgi:glycosyltransferase involved in cell wall biosynthesis